MGGKIKQQQLQDGPRHPLACHKTQPSTHPGCSTEVSGMTSTSALRSRIDRTTRVGLLARLTRLAALPVLPSSLAALLLEVVSSVLGQRLPGSGSRRTTHVLKVGSRLGCDRLILRGGIDGGQESTSLEYTTRC